MNIKPYKNYNVLINFNCNYNPDCYQDGYILRVKIFIISMICHYNKIGLTNLAKSISIPYCDKSSIDDTDSESFLHNGLTIQEYITGWGWKWYPNIISAGDLEDYKNNDEKKNYINEFLNDEEQTNLSELLDEVLQAGEYDDVCISYYTSKKVGKVMKYISENQLDDSSTSAEIYSLLNLLTIPFMNENFGTTFLIEDVCYIAFLEGNVSGMFYNVEEIDMYYPLYAYELDKCINKAYELFNLKEDSYE